VTDNLSSQPSIAIELRRDLTELAILTERLEQFGERHRLAANIVSTMNLASRRRSPTSSNTRSTTVAEKGTCR